MEVKIISQSGSHFLVSQDGRFAIVERRNKRFYNCHSNGRNSIGADQLSSIEQIIAPDDWGEEPLVRAKFAEITARGKDLAERMR